MPPAAIAPLAFPALPSNAVGKIRIDGLSTLSARFRSFTLPSAAIPVSEAKASTQTNQICGTGKKNVGVYGSPHLPP